jgi:uncharacterized protein involved in copper resistance
MYEKLFFPSFGQNKQTRKHKKAENQLYGHQFGGWIDGHLGVQIDGHRI